MNAATAPMFRTFSSRRARAVASAVAAVALFAANAPAQYRVPQGGDALDANNRLGSGGSNGAAGQRVNQRIDANSGNDVVTGNVTGGAGFRGIVPYRAPGQFNDFAAGSSIGDFASFSSSVSPSGSVYNNAGNVRPYYNEATTITAPSGYVRSGYAGGGYQPPSSLARGGAIDYRAANAFDGRATSLDARVDNNLSVPGGIDGGLDNTAGSAVNGNVVGNDPASAPLSLIAPGGSVAGRTERPISPYTSLARNGQYDALSPDQIGRLRGELLRDGQGQRLSPDRLTSLLDRNTERGNRPQDRTVDAARRVDDQAGGGAVEARVGADGRIVRGDDDAQGEDGGVRLAGPGDQSRQYEQLLERFNRFEKDPYADALRPYRPQPKQNGEAEEGGLPGVPDVLRPQPDQRPPQPGAEDADTDERQVADPPVNVRSLAAGVSSPTLKQVYEQAETLMADGQYINAIARYDAAERLVPNQPLTLVGRATAELAAGYYRRSAVSLRRAFQDNRELTMARLDLPGLVGADRVQQVTDSLRERAVASRNDPEPVFLLGFIAYSTGNNEQSARLPRLGRAPEQRPVLRPAQDAVGLGGAPGREKATRGRGEPGGRGRRRGPGDAAGRPGGPHRFAADPPGRRHRRAARDPARRRRSGFQQVGDPVC